MKLRFTRRATEDLTQIADFIRAENPAAAVAVRNAIYESLQLLLPFRTSAGHKRPKTCASS